MEIAEHTEQGILVLSLNGRLDHAGAGVLDDVSREKIASGVRSMIVDFGGTSFVASTGIRALMVPAQELLRVGGRFAVTGLNEQVQRLFEIAGLQQLFQVYPTAAEAARDGVWP